MVQKPPSPSTSPDSATSGSGSGSGNGTAAAAFLPPLTPKSIQNQNQNPYPTTFIQADTQSFKQVVQMLTGSAETAAKRSGTQASNPPFAPKNPIPPLSKNNKKPAFKLYERRSSMKNLKMISPLLPHQQHHHHRPSAFSPRNQPEVLSPSILDFPSLALSPVTPLIPDPFNRSPHPNGSTLGAVSSSAAEDRAIAEKGFYFHPSPRTTTPKLLPLFPLTSPRMQSSSAAQ